MLALLSANRKQWKTASLALLNWSNNVLFTQARQWHKIGGLRSSVEPFLNQMLSVTSVLAKKVSMYLYYSFGSYWHSFFFFFGNLLAKTRLAISMYLMPGLILKDCTGSLHKTQMIQPDWIISQKSVFTQILWGWTFSWMPYSDSDWLKTGCKKTRA